MNRLALPAVLLLLSATSLSAQTLRSQSGGLSLESQTNGAATSIHLTGILAASPEGQASLAAYHAAKKNGTLSANRSDANYAVGSVATFQVYNYERSAYDNLDFTLKVEASSFNIWVETAELNNGRITDAKLADLRAALETETPESSFDPTKGVIELDETVFGNPTDVDQSGKTDVLLLDIRDGFDPNQGGASVQGFVDPNNLSGINMRDILHLDTFPSLSEGANVNNLYLTAAHEYQHLIRFNYDPGEITFVDEGMSEWAEVVTGFGPRRNTYWSNVSELRRSLLSWRGTLEPGVDFDYQRAGLFTNYIAQRLGVMATGAITRASASGAAGYSAALSSAGFVLKEVIADFHVANKVNDGSVAAKYSQGSWFPSVDAATTIVYDGATQSQASVRADGATGNPAPLSPGAVVYHRWANVANFQLTADALAGAGPVASMRERLRARLILETAEGVITVSTVDLGGEPLSISGSYRYITLVIAHVDITLPSGFNSSNAPFFYSSSWVEGGIGSNTTTVAYEDGNVVVISENGGSTQLEAWPFSEGTLGVDASVANSFEVPEGQILAGVDIALFYQSYFDSGIPAEPRDYTLKVHALNQQTGGPGDVVLTLARNDDSAFPTIPAMGFDSVDLSGNQAELAQLSGTFFVSASNAGTDANTVVMALSEWASDPADNPSWLYTNFGGTKRWAPFRSIRVGPDSDPYFEDLVAPIRARFVTFTSTEDATDLPAAYVLEPNYPNPFNPSTSIAYHLPAATHTRLAVYDLLGREVDVLVDGVHPAGRHEVRFEAGKLASGMYLYALDAGGQRLTRSMLLLK